MIGWLLEKIEGLETENAGLRARIDELLEQITKQSGQLSEQSIRLSEQSVQLGELLGEIRLLRKSLERSEKREGKYKRELSKLQSELSYARNDRYGDRRQRPRDPGAGGSSGSGSESGTEAEMPDRGESEENMGEWSQEIRAVPEAAQSSSTGYTADRRNRPERYSRMEYAGRTSRHRSDRCKLPEGARVIETRYVPVYSLKVGIRCDEYEMLHVVEKGKKPYWLYVPSEGEKDRMLRVEGTKASPELMQALAYEVYLKGVTFGNVHRWLRDMGLRVSKNTLRNWLKKGKRELDKLIPVLKEAALEKGSIVNCDETWCKVRKQHKYRKEYMWVLVNRKEGIVIFFYDNGSRGRQVLTDFLGSSELKALMSDGYNAYTFLDGDLETADHLICMAHARGKFVTAANHGGSREALEFVDLINELYDLEWGYRERKLSASEIRRERQGSRTEEIVRKLRRRLDELRSLEKPVNGYYMEKALEYLDRFWEGLFRYRSDGAYPIDNNAAERSIRPFCAKRKTSLHFGSDAGAEMSAVYHSIVSTLRMQERSVWEFFGKFFRGVATGEAEYLSLLGLGAG